MHDLKDCRADVEEAIKLDPAVKNAYATRAWFEEVDGKWAEAAADRTVAMSERNAAPDNLLARAYDYAQAGKKSLARRDYEEIARRPVKTAEDYIHQGEALHTLGREELAAAAYAAARRLEPSDKWVLNGVAWFEATSPDPKYRDGPAAVRDATRAAELSQWKEPDILDTLAAAYAEAGDFPSALRYEKQALAFHKMDTKGQVLEKNLREIKKGKPIRDHGLAE